MMKKWWQKPLRALALDFSDCEPDSVDIHEIVNESFLGHINTLVVSATGRQPGGVAFYQSKIAPHFPGLLERDLLRESLEVAHTNGQKVVVSIASIWGGQELFQARPDWVQRDASGEPVAWDAERTSLAFCPNSPYREYLLSLLAEICAHYAVDGFFFNSPGFQSWCNCEHCQRKFLDEYGTQLPLQADWMDPIWQAFVGWRYRQISEWRETLYTAVKAEARCVFFQGAFPLAVFLDNPVRIEGLGLPAPYPEPFGGGTYIPLSHGTDLPREARLQDIVHIGLPRRGIGEPLWWLGLCCRYGDSLARGRQVLMLNDIVQTPFKLVGLPEAELRLSMAELLANSASPLLFRKVPDSGDQPAWDLFYSLLGDARKIEPFLEERESLKFAALLISETTHNSLDLMRDRPSHMDCLKGWAKALLQEHVLFDVVSEADLEKVLKRYRVLVLPNPSCLSSRSKQLIREYAALGNGVVGSFEAGMFGERGQRTTGDDFGELFGVNYMEGSFGVNDFDAYMLTEPECPLPAGLPAGRRIPTGGIQIGVSLAGARPVASLFSGASSAAGLEGPQVGSPTVLAYDQGVHGRSVYFAPPLDAHYLKYGVEAQRKLLAAAVLWAAQVDPPLRVDNAPLTLAVTAFYQPVKKRLILHLVNSVQDEAYRPIAEVPECRGVRLLIQTSGEVRGLEVLGDSRLPNASRWGSQLSVELPPFRYHLELVVAYR
jgi:hypothetical protein